MDIPLQNPELELFTDRSSFIQEGQPKASPVVTIADEAVKVRLCHKGGQHNELSYGHPPKHSGTLKRNESTFILGQGMPLLLYMYMEPFIKKGDY